MVDRFKEQREGNDGSGGHRHAMFKETSFPVEASKIRDRIISSSDKITQVYNQCVAIKVSISDSFQEECSLMVRDASYYETLIRNNVQRQVALEAYEKCAEEIEKRMNNLEITHKRAIDAIEKGRRRIEQGPKEPYRDTTEDFLKRYGRPSVTKITDIESLPEFVKKLVKSRNWKGSLFRMQTIVQGEPLKVICYNNYIYPEEGVIILENNRKNLDRLCGPQFPPPLYHAAIIKHQSDYAAEEDNIPDFKPKLMISCKIENSDIRNIVMLFVGKNSMESFKQGDGRYYAMLSTINGSRNFHFSQHYYDGIEITNVQVTRSDTDNYIDYMEYTLQENL